MSALDWADEIAAQSIRRRRPYPEEATISDLINIGWSEGRARGHMARKIRKGEAVWEWALDDNGKKVKVYRRIVSAAVPALPGDSGGHAHPGRSNRRGVRSLRTPKGRP